MWSFPEDLTERKKDQETGIQDSEKQKETGKERSRDVEIERDIENVKEGSYIKAGKGHVSSWKFYQCAYIQVKTNYRNEDQLRCMLKDIYFPYIQNDEGSDESIQTSAPVEFEVNGTNLTKVAGDEVVETNLAAYKGSTIHFWSFT